jgi:hypothetical protein
LLKISIEESYGEEVKKYAKDDSEDGIDEGKYELALSAASAMTLRNNPDY